VLVVDSRRRIPRTDTLLAQPPFTEAVGRLGAARVKEAITAAQDRARRGEIAPEEVPDLAAGLLPATATTLRPVINATGVLLHTNLGRAPLSAAARAALAASAGSTDVEFDLATGQRARRGRGALDALRMACPQAEDVHIVNNNAAALVLAATALASGREIIVSRGEMVEIGDGFRLPDLLACTGARLREVGTTNRTTAADYAAAIGPDTGFILKVHPSNFRILGFTSEATIAEVAAMAAAPGRGPVPVVADIGSGLLAPEPVLPDEPDAASALASGRGPGHRQRGQAARRTAGRAAARPGRPGHGVAAAPAGPGAPGRQADPGRAGGHAARPGHADRGGPARAGPAAPGPGRAAGRRPGPGRTGRPGRRE
jgi:L-seryl-tRNA(Ser) seleniumtransferase